MLKIADELNEIVFKSNNSQKGVVSTDLNECVKKAWYAFNGYNEKPSQFIKLAQNNKDLVRTWVAENLALKIDECFSEINVGIEGLPDAIGKIDFQIHQNGTFFIGFVYLPGPSILKFLLNSRKLPTSVYNEIQLLMSWSAADKAIVVYQTDRQFKQITLGFNKERADQASQQMREKYSLVTTSKTAPDAVELTGWEKQCRNCQFNYMCRK